MNVMNWLYERSLDGSLEKGITPNPNKHDIVHLSVFTLKYIHMYIYVHMYNSICYCQQV